MADATQAGAGQTPPAGTTQQPPAQPAASQAMSAVPPGMKRIRLKRSIILGGEHAEQGATFDVATALAHRLVGEGSAEHHVPEQAPTSVTRMITPGNADPKPRQVAPAPPKVKEKK